MKKTLLILSIAYFTTIASSDLSAQGCVAIKGNAATCMLTHPDTTNESKWLFTTSARYFKSFRHFSGTEENKDRLAQGTEVINHTSIVDLALSRSINDRWAIMIDVPIIANSRSSLYEHGLVNGAY